MPSSSLTPPERARKAEARIFQRLQEGGTAGSIATAMGVSEATLSRIKNERLSEVLLFLAHLGMKVVPTDFKCVDREAYDFLTSTHARVMRQAPELIWEREE